MTFADAPLRVLGVSLIGATAGNAVRLGLTLVWVLAITVLVRLLRLAERVAPRRITFWTHQGIAILASVVMIAGIVSIWMRDPKQLTTAVGLVTAGVAFALQRVITAMAGYLVILRGRTFTVGDRIVMGGVRGDVLALGFMQTTILEMGQSDAEQADKPSMWVHARQYTGRVVTVSNAKIFDEPIYNYTKDLPFFYDELRTPVPYASDHARAEAILLAAARRHTAEVQTLSEGDRKALARRYDVDVLPAEPEVYYRLTDNWVELTVRFLTADHGTRQRKNQMSREILAEFAAAGLEIASGTYAIVQVPKLQIALEAPPSPDAR